MKSIFLCASLFLLSGLCFAQDPDGYKIPFGSSGNTIELAVENTSSLKTSTITVEPKSLPAWIKFAKQSESITELSGKSEQTVSFTFSIDKAAPVGKKEVLSFVISSANGQSWTKEITISVAPPDRFELFQNYPNPFNPSTTIAYQLTVNSRVRLTIYNLLGQEVVRLLDGERSAGIHQEVWNASSVSSGIYVYRMIAIDPSGKEVVEKKMMTLIK